LQVRDVPIAVGFSVFQASCFFPRLRCCHHICCCFFTASVLAIADVSIAVGFAVATTFAVVFSLLQSLILLLLLDSLFFRRLASFLVFAAATIYAVVFSVATGFVVAESACEWCCPSCYLSTVSVT
jgi:hypothetical protein